MGEADRCRRATRGTVRHRRRPPPPRSMAPASLRHRVLDQMRHSALALVVQVVSTVASFGGCAAPKPPTRPPDLEGAVIGRTPRLPTRDGAAHLVIAAAPARVDVALGPGVRVLEALPGGGYR